jgi:hypothetical protein
MSRSSYALPALVFAAISCGAVASLAVGTPGCTVLTNDALPDDAGTFEAGGDAGPSTACTTCVTQECTGAWSVCLTDSRCVALRGCSTPFSESSAGRQACFCDSADAAAATPDGGADPLAAYAAFASCNDARTCGKCATDCTATCANGATKTTAGSCGAGDDAGADADAAVDLDAGDAGDADAPEASAPSEAPSADGCSSCVANRCGDPKKACGLGSECSAFLGCAYGCVDAACVDACGKAHSTGRASAAELATCTLTSCSSACGY